MDEVDTCRKADTWASLDGRSRCSWAFVVTLSAVCVHVCNVHETLLWSSARMYVPTCCVCVNTCCLAAVYDEGASTLAQNVLSWLVRMVWEGPPK